MKIAPYSPIQKNLSRFESVKLLTTQKINPRINQKLTQNILRKKSLRKIDLIITSNLLRAKETAKFLTKNFIVDKGARIINSSLLNEIKFKIGCSNKDYEKEKSNIIRKNFIELFIQDKLIDKRQEIQNKFTTFDRLIKKWEKSRNILCISHTFFIKLYLIYRDNPHLFDNPKILWEYINPNE